MTATARTGADMAMDMLLEGYREETRLYRLLLEVAREQRTTLLAHGTVARFSDLLDAKEDLVEMIGQIEQHLEYAKRVVLSHGPATQDGCAALAAILDHVTQVIAEVQDIEEGNAAMLERLTGVAAPGRELAQNLENSRQIR